MSTTIETSGNALALIGTMTPALAFAPGNVDDLLARVKAEARAQAAKLDVSRPADRAAIASLRLKVAKTKTGWDGMATAKAEQAARDAAAETERALVAERKRVADEQAAAEAERASRAKDKAHRAAINNEAMADLVAAGLDDKTARAAVTAIARNAVRHCRIEY
jgi:hypothetical protein